MKIEGGFLPALAELIPFLTGTVLPALEVEAFAGGKIKICVMSVERLVDEWVATSSPMFATELPDFHKFSRGSSLMTFFSGSLLVVGHGISSRLY